MKKRLLALLLCLAMLLPTLLCGCGSKAENVVNVYNWGEYIDESIFDDFEAATVKRVPFLIFHFSFLI